MGLFLSRKTPDDEFVIQVVRFFGMSGADAKYEKEVRRFFDDHGKERIPTLVAAAEKIPNPQTQKELYAVSTAYVWAGAKYRQHAIKYLRAYLAAGGVWPGTPGGVIDYGDGNRADQREVQRASAYADLGAALAGEHEYGEAVSAYQSAIDIVPFVAAYYAKQADALVKMGNIDGGISVLKKAKPRLSKDGKTVVAGKLEELEKKKAKGYVYKPRKQGE